MALDPTTGNNLANAVAGHLKNINGVVNDAEQGTGQALDLAGIKQGLEANQDALVASVGQSGFGAMENQITLLNADTRDGVSAEGGAGEAYNADINGLVSMLNQAGLQVDVDAGQGHYDAGTVLAHASGSTTDANTADAQIATTGSQYSSAIASMNNTLAGTAQYTQGASDAGAAMKSLISSASNWIGGANLSADQQSALTAGLAGVQSAADTFGSNPTQSGAFQNKYNDLLNAMSSAGYTGATRLV